MRKLLFLCFMAVSFISLDAAQRTVYGARASFESALDSNSIIKDDYSPASGYPGGYAVYDNTTMNAFFGETMYESTNLPNYNVISNTERYCAGCNGSYRLDFSATSVGNGNGVYGVGFEFNNSAALPYTAFVTYGNGDTENIPIMVCTGCFWGITSSARIKTIHFGLPNGGSTNAGNFWQDNLTIGAAAPGPPPSVPTLSQWGLFLFGLVFITLGFVLVYQQKLQAIAIRTKSSKPSIHTFRASFPFNKSMFRSSIKIALGMVIGGALLIQIGWGEITGIDVLGLIMTLPILTYLLHLSKLIKN